MSEPIVLYELINLAHGNQKCSLGKHDTDQMLSIQLFLKRYVEQFNSLTVSKKMVSQWLVKPAAEGLIYRHYAYDILV